MTQLIYILFSPVGRIRRRDFWIGLSVITAVTLFGTVLIQPNFFTYDTGSDSFPPPNLGVRVLDLILFFPGFAVTVKRLNDRDWPSWMKYLILIVCLPFVVGPFFGMFWGIDNATPIELAGWTTLSLLMAFLIVDNGILRGTIGANRYGADPLQHAT